MKLDICFEKLREVFQYVLCQKLISSWHFNEKVERFSKSFVSGQYIANLLGIWQQILFLSQIDVWVRPGVLEKSKGVKGNLNLEEMFIHTSIRAKNWKPVYKLCIICLIYTFCWCKLWGQCPLSREWYQTSLKPVVRPSVCPSVCPSGKITCWPKGPFCCSWRLLPSAGARKKPPVGGWISSWL